ncbi:XtrA/YqaO family protein [Aneurinibacillus aneurinilyticus]|uniref:Uncharacterized protein n=1 Tax=Aneurinibacillus aneurinilyticus ATCC 12856 TaxID=649747 RepID=U1X8N8_ANEAE|nr:XtrA/YqaO family protein [Aneurinibacillus aneurinilyticus]ERI10913.1 hypothetical protein HMPREF0083_01025 [Aneurinibacillus aneurinilyticus ATCC 12856]MED0704929.1 XtrA/YqaO family protein [Aneurinibacillus aneurinilyticus]MED0723069.1 XtrA/YqaO family protein [Aneurinibacillus aneurinilyticus]MED0731450.1 XtrA/YqaO family protein [Aneurinibacillus aneurinilyticus]MED0740073.1 XtrA/YqaO family protein [Aneurinibacillus aneurinilyticus]
MKSIELTPDISTMKVEVPVTNEAYMVLICEGKAKLIKLPENGETRIVMHQKKIKRHLNTEGEEF